MAERLTRADYNKWHYAAGYCSKKDCWKLTAIEYKLGQLEDIMEEYKVEELYELSNALEYAKVIEQTLSEHGIKDNEELDSALIKLIEARAFEKKIKLLENDRNTWKRACELACKETPFHCPNPPERYNAQDEYGSDEPYWIEESGCEFNDPAMCLECQVNYYYQQAEKENNEQSN